MAEGSVRMESERVRAGVGGEDVPREGGSQGCGEVVRVNRAKDQIEPKVMGPGCNLGHRAGSWVRA